MADDINELKVCTSVKSVKAGVATYTATDIFLADKHGNKLVESDIRFLLKRFKIDHVQVELASQIPADVFSNTNYYLLNLKQQKLTEQELFELIDEMRARSLKSGPRPLAKL